MIGFELLTPSRSPSLTSLLPFLSFVGGNIDDYLFSTLQG